MEQTWKSFPMGLYALFSRFLPPPPFTMENASNVGLLDRVVFGAYVSHYLHAETSRPFSLKLGLPLTKLCVSVELGTKQPVSLEYTAFCKIQPLHTPGFRGKHVCFWAAFVVGCFSIPVETTLHCKWRLPPFTMECLRASLGFSKQCPFDSKRAILTRGLTHAFFFFETLRLLCVCTDRLF